MALSTGEVDYVFCLTDSSLWDLPLKDLGRGNKKIKEWGKENIPAKANITNYMYST